MENIIFIDLDGPVLDGKLRHWNCYSDIISEGGGNPIFIDEYWNMKRNKVKRDIILKKSDYKLGYDHFYQSWLNRIEKPEYLALDVLKPGIRNILKSWGERFSIILVTQRQSEKNLHNQLEKFKIRHLFNEIICCDFRIPNSKYCRVKNIAYKNAVVIGDTEDDKELANKLNASFIFVENGLRDRSFFPDDYTVTELCYLNIDEYIGNEGGIR